MPNNTQIRELLENYIETLLANQPTLAALVITRDPEFQVISLGSLDLENKKYRRNRLIAMVNDERAVLLEPWNILWYWSKDKSECATGPPSVQQERLILNSGEMVKFRDELREEQRQTNQFIFDSEIEKVLSRSKSVPTILSQYFLPMFYGLLGSLTYILRSLSTEIRDVTFTRVSATRYSLRWPLGMLAGVTIGLFFDPTQFAGLAAITPLGIAFLAGYGVELFFTGLDGLVRTFTRDGPERPKSETT